MQLRQKSNTASCIYEKVNKHFQVNCTRLRGSTDPARAPVQHMRMRVTAACPEMSIFCAIFRVDWNSSGEGQRFLSKR